LVHLIADHDAGLVSERSLREEAALLAGAPQTITFVVGRPTARHAETSLTAPAPLYATV
jgi:hypothetical protein